MARRRDHARPVSAWPPAPLVRFRLEDWTDERGPLTVGRYVEGRHRWRAARADWAVRAGVAWWGWTPGVSWADSDPVPPMRQTAE